MSYILPGDLLVKRTNKFWKDISHCNDHFCKLFSTVTKCFFSKTVKSTQSLTLDVFFFFVVLSELVSTYLLSCVALQFYEEIFNFRIF